MSRLADEIVEVLRRWQDIGVPDTAGELGGIMEIVEVELAASEATVRAQIASDIEATAPCEPLPDCNPYCSDCIRYRQAQRDAKIARGAT